MLIRRVLRIVDDARDAEYGPDIIEDNWEHTSLSVRFGSVTSSTWETYLQFLLTVPAGTELTSAVLEVTPHTAQATATTGYVEALDLFSGTLETDRHAVAAFTDAITWSMGAWSQNTRSAATRIDITDAVQAVLDRTGYAVGDYLTLKLTAPGGALRSIHGVGNNGGAQSLLHYTPTLALVYDDGLEPFAPASDALSMIQSLGGGETVVYTPGHGDARTISAIIERSPRQYIDGMSPTHAPGLAVSVANHPTNGISSAEIDTAIDTITVPARYGRAAETRVISGINYHDFGMLELELA